MELGSGRGEVTNVQLAKRGSSPHHGQRAIPMPLWGKKAAGG
jgi:hypothetical protein